MRWRGWLSILLLFPSFVRAETVVIESYAGSRPEDATATLKPLLDELRGDGYVVASPDLVARIGEKVSRAAGPMGAADLAETTKLVEGGWRAWLDGDFEPAAQQLGQALERFQENPATVAQSPELRDSIYRALVGLALARKRQGRADEAAAYMAELVRSFPDREFNRSAYGPEAQELYKKVKLELEQQKKSRLRVTVDDEGAVVFLNERYDSMGGGEKEVLPGRYRVYAQKGTVPGRVRVVDVAAGATVDVRVSWKLDASLVTRADAVALVSAGASPALAVTLARSLGADALVLVTIDQYEGRRAIIGRVVTVDSAKPSRVGVVALEPAAPGEDSIRGLGRFLAQGTPGPGIIVPKGDLTGEPAAAPDQPRWYGDSLGWGVAAGGLVLAGVGVGLFVHAQGLQDDANAALDEDEQTSKRDDSERFELFGGIAIGVGVAVAAAGVVKLVLHDTGSTQVVAGPGFVGLRGSF